MKLFSCPQIILKNSCKGGSSQGGMFNKSFEGPKFISQWGMMESGSFHIQFMHGSHQEQILFRKGFGNYLHILSLHGTLRFSHSNKLRIHPSLKRCIWSQLRVVGEEIFVAGKDPGEEKS